MSTESATLPHDVQALVTQTIESLQGLMPQQKNSFVNDKITDAVFSAVDAIAADMRELNKAIHGMCGVRLVSLLQPVLTRRL